MLRESCQHVSDLLQGSWRLVRVARVANMLRGNLQLSHHLDVKMVWRVDNMSPTNRQQVARVGLVEFGERHDTQAALPQQTTGRENVTEKSPTSS